MQANTGPFDLVKSSAKKKKPEGQEIIDQMDSYRANKELLDKYRIKRKSNKKSVKKPKTRLYGGENDSPFKD